MQKNNKRKILAIIPAAGKPTNKIMANSNLPDTMIPINGKPVISYIIEDLLERGISHIAVILHEGDDHTEKYISRRFTSRCTLTVMYDTKGGRGVGYSVYLAKPYLKGMDGVLIYLGDTIYKGPLTFNDDFLVVSSEYESPDKWCFVEKNKNGFRFINKPKAYEGNGKVLCGLYFFNNARDVGIAMSATEKKHSTIEMSHLLEIYAKKHSFKLVTAKGWYDCGNIENFYRAKIDFLKLRNFNSIAYDDLRGLITKSGRNRNKIVDEIQWFKKLPDDLKIFAPRLVDYKITPDSASYSLEFYGYQSLADFFILGSLTTKLWENIITKLFNVLDLFKTHTASLARSHYHAIYYGKTMERLEKMNSQSWWKKLFAQDTVTINGVGYKNINHFKQRLKEVPDDLFNADEMSFIHGDLCLSNILFDPGSGIFKFIDPRGNFGKPSLYGDRKYDMAKLRHSFRGLYDFIISDFFEFEERGGSEFIFTKHTEGHHDDIGRYFDAEVIRRGYDLEKIKLIEALLFLSMIPLHNDTPVRQKAMYLTGIQLLNENKILRSI